MRSGLVEPGSGMSASRLACGVQRVGMPASPRVGGPLVARVGLSQRRLRSSTKKPRSIGGACVLGRHVLGSISGVEASKGKATRAKFGRRGLSAGAPATIGR